MISFKNKNILITGASGGIGNALVKKFVSLGANVLGSGTKTEKLELIKKRYPNIKVKKFDISNHSGIEEFMDNVALDLGGLDILINNAGLNIDKPFLKLTDNDWQKVLQINLTGTFICSQEFAIHFGKRKNGHIINSINLNIDAIEKKEFDKKLPIVAYSNNENDAIKAAKTYVELGYQTVYYLQGGINSWIENDMPLSGEKSHGK